MRLRPVTIFVVTIIIILHPTSQHTSYAESAHKLIQPALVYLKATGSYAVENKTVELNSHATGFIVSTNGLVLTTYQLISDLGEQVDPSTVKLRASIGRKQEEPGLYVSIIDAIIDTELLLLKLRSGDNFSPVELSAASLHNHDDPIYSSGFVHSLPHLPANRLGNVVQQDGPGGYTWTVQIQFEYGQGGSPVYNKEGQVIGISKGGTLSVANSYMIPVEFADALLAQVRLRSIQQALDRYEILNTKLDWKATLIKAYDQTTIRIVYDKYLKGGPHVDKVSVDIEAFWRNKKKVAVFSKLGPLVLSNRQPLNESNNSNRNGGAFEIAHTLAWGKIREEQKRGNIDSEEFIWLVITIEPTLSGGDILDKESLTINVYE